MKMNWNTLLCEKRRREHSSKESSDLRSEFQKDYHRIIQSASFRRLQDKTQVFPLDKSDFVRTVSPTLWRYHHLQNHWDI